MKIIQVINALTFGGAQMIMLDLVKKLLQEGHEVEVLAFRDGPIGKKLQDLGCKTHILGENFLDLLAFRKMNQLVRKFQPDLIHSHLFRATLWARLVCRCNPRVALITSIHGRETNFFHYCEKLTARFSNHLIFPSQHLLDWYRKHICHFKAQNASVIYPGVDILARAEIQSENAKPAIIGTLSRLHPVKGVDILLRAAGILRKRGADFKLLIGGDGKQRSELSSLAHQEGIADICSFVGEIDDVKEFLSRFSIFVAASRHEAFGIHVCEAMERGIPVVAAEVGGLPEQISDSQTGLLFEPDNPSSLAEKLEVLLNNRSLRAHISQAAREKVLTTFTRENALEKHLALYSSFFFPQRHLHFCISSAELGGGERLALSLMKSLKAQGWKVSVTCCGSPLADELEQAGIDFSSAGMKFYGVFFALKLFCDLLKYRPDLISSHLNKASLIAGHCGKFLGIPVVSHVHGLNRRNYYAASDHLIAVSNSVREHLLKQGIAGEKLTTIKNCIAQKPSLQPKSLSFPLNICIIAKLHANKGHEWALRALLAENRPEFKLHIIGDGPEKNRLVKLCHKLDANQRVEFYGFVQEPAKILEKMNVALLPSLGEGIPLSLLETMGQGIPAIATRVGGIPEIIIDGKNGLLIEPENAEQLLQALTRISEPAFYEKLSQGALEQFSLLNNYEKMIAATANIFADFIKR